MKDDALAPTLDAVLAAQPFTRDLAPEHRGFLAAHGRHTHLAAGEFVMREGGDANTLYLLERGRVSLEVHVPGRGVVQIESLGEGDVLGLSWLVPPYRWHLDARVVEPAEALAFNAVAIRDRLETDPAFGAALLRRLVVLLVQRLERARLARLDIYHALDQRAR